MSTRMVRILMAKFGEGHESAMMKLAFAFRDEGYEVIYTELQKPGAIVASAIQESVDHIGITTLPGSRIEDLARVVELLKQEDAPYIKVTAGGVLDCDDVLKIKESGIAEFFPKGTSISELIQWAKENIKPTYG
jgi:methylmalonyl-CoA mutase, C-terminal domain